MFAGVRWASRYNRWVSDAETWLSERASRWPSSRHGVMFTRSPTSSSSSVVDGAGLAGFSAVLATSRLALS